MSGLGLGIGIGIGYGGGGAWSPAKLGGTLLFWYRPGIGLTLVPSASTTTGTSPPAVTLSGTPAASQAVSATPYVEIDVNDVTGGTGLGQAKFQWKLNGSVQQTGQPTAASFAIGSTGLTAVFAAGPYANDNVYKFNTNASQWNDQSGQGRHLTQGTAAVQLIAAAGGGPTGQPLLHASGGQQMQTASLVSAGFGRTDWTLVSVHRLSTVAATNGVLANGVAAANLAYQADSPTRDMLANAVAVRTDGSATTSWEAWTGSSTAGTAALQVNGGTVAITNAGAVARAATGPFQIGNSGGTALTGDIAEIWGVSVGPSAADLANTNAYLSAQYGL